MVFVHVLVPIIRYGFVERLSLLGDIGNLPPAFDYLYEAKLRLWLHVHVVLL